MIFEWALLVDPMWNSVPLGELQWSLVLVYNLFLYSDFPCSDLARDRLMLTNPEICFHKEVQWISLEHWLCLGFFPAQSGLIWSQLYFNLKCYKNTQRVIQTLLLTKYNFDPRKTMSIDCLLDSKCNFLVWFVLSNRFRS